MRDPAEARRVDRLSHPPLKAVKAQVMVRRRSVLLVLRVSSALNQMLVVEAWVLYHAES